jgi:hypothetical protein
MHTLSALSIIPGANINLSSADDLLNDSHSYVSEAKTTNVKPVVEIYNFHQKRRCATCLAIEKSVRNVVDGSFKKEVQDGRVKLHVLDVEDRANANSAKKFKAYGLALFVVNNNKGKEDIVNLTAEGVRHARRNPEQFEETLRARILQGLK